MNLGDVHEQAAVPGEALSLGGTADVIVRVRPGRFAGLKRWARREGLVLRDLRSPARPFLVTGRLAGVVAVGLDDPDSSGRLSLFAEPVAGTTAGALIEELGLPGIRIGCARLCGDDPGSAEPVHPLEGRGAEDFRMLGEYIAERVRRVSGVQLPLGFHVES